MRRAVVTGTNTALCEECEQQSPTSKCEDCNMLFCDSCSTEIHSVGALQKHRMRTATCEKCHIHLATHSCEECEVGYCENCSVSREPEETTKSLGFDSGIRQVREKEKEKRREGAGESTQGYS